jgi:hypothetical protein
MVCGAQCDEGNWLAESSKQGAIELIEHGRSTT